tara:strand:- start:368 stop:1270 length:903 start_codon:yes stop_codon:yes gene_type:complete
MSDFRIISLFPSSSDILFDLNLEKQLVAVSHECLEKDYFNQLPKVTSTCIDTNVSQSEIDNQVRDKLKKNEPIYKIDINLIKKLKPTHILTQDICDVCAVSSNTIEVTLKDARYELPNNIEIITLNGKTFSAICDDVLLVGKIFDKKNEAREMIHLATKKWNSLKKSKNYKKLLMLEWINPPFSPGHWIPEQVELAGFDCLFSSPGDASKTLSWEEVNKKNPDYIGVICCGYNENENKVFAKSLYNLNLIQNIKAIQKERVFFFDSKSFFSKPSLKIVEGAELICNMLGSKNSKFRCLRP